MVGTWQSPEGAWAQLLGAATRELHERMRFIDSMCWQAVMGQAPGYLDRLVVIEQPGVDGWPAVASRLVPAEVE